MGLLDRDPFASVRPPTPPAPDPWIAVLAALDQLRAAITDTQPPAPVVTVAPVDLTDIVTAVQGIRGPATADEIAHALAAVLAPSQATDESTATILSQVANSLDRLDHRLQGVGTQAYGGGAVSFTQAGLTQLTDALTASPGTWGYAAGVNGTPTLPDGARVTQISAVALAADGSFTIDGGDAVTLPAGSAVDLDIGGTLTAPTIVFDSSVDAYVVQYVV